MHAYVEQKSLRGHSQSLDTCLLEPASLLHAPLLSGREVLIGSLLFPPPPPLPTFDRTFVSDSGEFSMETSKSCQKAQAS